MTSQERTELLRLLSSLCDGAIDSVDRARLDDTLRGSAEARRLYLEYIDVHARLTLDGSRLPAFTRPSTVPPRSPERRRSRSWWSHAAVAVLAVLATLFVTRLFDRPDQEEGRLEVAHAARPIRYIATLTHASGGDWDANDPSWHVGSRLAPKSIRFAQGVAQVRFDSGVELVLEGPVEIRLTSTNSATLLYGKAVFRADQTTTPFDLTTPDSLILDFGTEYAILVGEESEEIHVFEGEIRRTSRADRNRIQALKAGQARRYSPNHQDGLPTPIAAERFVRKAPDQPEFPEARPSLLVYEGFDYPTDRHLMENQADGGIGWKGPWRHSFARLIDDPAEPGPTLNHLKGLTRPNSKPKEIGGCFEFMGFTKAFRHLEKPIRLDTDDVYYLSYLFRHQGPPLDPVNALGVLLWPEEDGEIEIGDQRMRLNICVGGSNQVFTHLLGIGSRTPLPLTYGETYLLVAKIVAGETNPDQIFVRVYAPREPVERDEPEGWSVVAPPFQSDLVFTWLQLHVNSKHRQSVDELRIGHTWQAVTSPWHAGN